MRDQLEARLSRFEELERALVDPEVLAAPQRLAAVAREHGTLAKLARGIGRSWPSSGRLPTSRR